MGIFSGENGSNPKSELENPADRLCIGMPYDEIVRLLGEPGRINPGTEMLEIGSGGRVVASDETRAKLSKTQYCLWMRPEGRYLLVLEDGKLARIHEKPSAPLMQPDPNTLLSLESANCKISIRIPQGWTQNQTNTGYLLHPENAISLPSPEGQIFSPGILLLSAPIQNPIGNIQEFVDSWFDEDARKLFQRFELISKRESKVNACPAAWFEFRFDKLDQRWAAIVLVASDGRMAYYADGSFLVSDQTKCSKTVREILESFSIA
jgi:hypothetical protein